MTRYTLLLCSFLFLGSTASLAQTPVCEESNLCFYDVAGEKKERTLYVCKGDGSDRPITRFTEMGVSPEPTTDYVQIGLVEEDRDTADVPLSIYANDLRFVDRVVLSARELQHRIDVSNYSPGVYYIVPDNKEYHRYSKASFIVLQQPYLASERVLKSF